MFKNTSNNTNNANTKNNYIISSKTDSAEGPDSNTYNKDNEDSDFKSAVLEFRKNITKSNNTNINNPNETDKEITNILFNPLNNMFDFNLFENNNINKDKLDKDFKEIMIVNTDENYCLNKTNVINASNKNEKNDFLPINCEKYICYNCFKTFEIKFKENKNVHEIEIFNDLNNTNTSYACSDKCKSIISTEIKVSLFILFLTKNKTENKKYLY